MKYPAYSVALIVLIGVTSVVFGQGKGVDSQNQRITDTGNSRAAGNNGTKQDTGTTGSGINFGKDKTRSTTALPNPYRVTGRRDVLLRAVADVMRDRKLIVDDAASKPSEGIIISQPYTRYTITVEVQAIDGGSSNISVNAKVEGRTDGPTGAEWTTLQSTGAAEQDFLSALIENVTGSAPGKP